MRIAAEWRRPRRGGLRLPAGAANAGGGEPAARRRPPLPPRHRGDAVPRARRSLWAAARREARRRGVPRPHTGPAPADGRGPRGHAGTKGLDPPLRRLPPVLRARRPQRRRPPRLRHGVRAARLSRRNAVVHGRRLLRARGRRRSSPGPSSSGTSRSRPETSPIDRDAVVITPDLSDEPTRRYRWDALHAVLRLRPRRRIARDAAGLANGPRVSLSSLELRAARRRS